MHSEVSLTSTVTTAEDSIAQPLYNAYFYHDLTLPVRCKLNTKDRFGGLTAINAREGAGNGNFFKKVEWAPDASSLLTSSNDNCVRLFQVGTDIIDGADESEFSIPIERYFEGPIYDVCWYPYTIMAPTQESCSIFAISTADHGVRLIDSSTLETRSAYLCTNHLEEVIAPTALCFTLDGSQLYAGLNGQVQVFHVDRPGREAWRRLNTTPTRKACKGQKGIISSIVFNPSSPYYAISSYASQIGLYSTKTNDILHVIKPRNGGPRSSATQLCFDPSGTFLLSTHRQDDQIYCTDLRTMETVWAALRGYKTNQRLSITTVQDITGTKVIAAGAGDRGNEVGVFNLLDGSRVALPPLSLNEQRYGDNALQHNDVVSWVTVKDSWWATCSGERKFRLSQTTSNSDSDSDSENECNEEMPRHRITDNSLKLWQLQGQWHYIDQSVPVATEQAS